MHDWDYHGFSIREKRVCVSGGEQKISCVWVKKMHFLSLLPSTFLSFFTCLLPSSLFPDDGPDEESALRQRNTRDVSRKCEVGDRHTESEETGRNRQEKGVNPIHTHTYSFLSHVRHTHTDGSHQILDQMLERETCKRPVLFFSLSSTD